MFPAVHLLRRLRRGHTDPLHHAPAWARGHAFSVSRSLAQGRSGQQGVGGALAWTAGS